MSFVLPSPDCPLCPRLAAYRHENRERIPQGYNGAVPSFGSLDAEVLIVGLAPGVGGANTTGRPFTGDYAGIILYGSLLEHGFASGDYQARPDDGLKLLNCRISNAVRCVPPENKPETSEIRTCNQFLAKEIAAMPKLKAVLSLGGVSHKAVLSACGHKAAFVPFQHGGSYTIPLAITGRKIQLISTYHSSRYNINTGRLTPQMFSEVIASVKTFLQSSAS